MPCDTGATDRPAPTCWPVVLLAVLTVWAFRHELERAGYKLLGTPRRERV